MSSKAKPLVIDVPDVTESEIGPRDAESRAVGADAGFQQLVRESRERRKAGEPGVPLEEILAEVAVEEAEDEEAAAARPGDGNRKPAEIGRGQRA